jgi:hypothetical protein
MTETSEFVIGRHKTSHKHYDLVLGINRATRHLIVPNSLPKKFGEKRIGKWEIWDEGHFEIESSSSIKLVIKSIGKRFKGRYLLLVPGWGRWTGKRLWVIEKIKMR